MFLLGLKHLCFVLLRSLNIAVMSTYTQICACVVYVSVRDSVFIGKHNKPTAVKGPETEPEVAEGGTSGKRI